MQVADLWLNDKKLTTHFGGYQPFTIDLTGRLTLGKPNTLVVKLDNSDNPDVPPGKPQNQLDFTYFGGLYRDVSLDVLDPLHITDEILANQVAGGGIFVRYAKVAADQAVVEIQTEVANERATAATCQVKQELVDAAGAVVASAIEEAKMAAGTRRAITQTLTVEKPKLWHPYHPDLYALRTTILAGDRIADNRTTRLGLRRIEFKSGGNAWDFTNTTIFDGSVVGVPTYICISGGSATDITLVDGLTIQNGANAATSASAGGAKINGSKTTMQNCIVTGCKGTNTASGSSSGVFLAGAGTVQDCYIHHNTSTTGAPGGMSITGASCRLSGSTIAYNSSSNSYGGLSLLGVTGDVSIADCKFEYNTATAGNAGAIGGYITNTAAQNPISITNCSFTSNTAGASGGAFYVNFSNATNGPASQVNLTSCTFTSNSAAASTSTTGGGAVILNTGTFTFDKCTFTNNYTTKSIGGAVLVSSNSATFKNSTFTGNTSGTTTTANGSAIYCITSATMNNCVVAGNTGINAIYVKAAAGVSGTFNNVTIASNVSSLAAPVGINLNAAVVASTFTNCLLYNCSATPISYSGSFPPVVTFTGFGTDVATLPTYANATNCINTIAAASFVNAATNDYHLAVGSTAINAGTTIAACSPDIANITRPQGSAYDMGAYEIPYYNTTVTFNDNGTVNSYLSGDVDSKLQGTQLAFTISPKSGYKITSVLYNSVEVKGDMVGDLYTAPALSTNATLVVQFDLATGLIKTQNDFQCFSTNNSIEIRGGKVGEELTIFGVTGIKIKSERINSLTMSIALPNGIYIVSIGENIKKIAVK